MDPRGTSRAFAAIGPTQLERIATDRVLRRYRKGATLFVQGDVPDYVYVVESGTVRVVVYQEDGRELVLGHAGPGAILGEASLFSGDRRSATAEVLEPCSAVLIPLPQFMTVLRETPDLALSVIAALSCRLRVADARIAELVFLDAKQRVVSAINRASGGVAVGTSGGTILRLSQAELASLAGVSRETATRVIGELVAQGVLRTARGKLEIIDRRRFAHEMSGCVAIA